MSAPRRHGIPLRAAVGLLLTFAVVLGLQVAAAPAAFADGTPNGTSATAAGCSPYYAVQGQTGSVYICLPSVVQGVRTPDPGVCAYNGFAARRTQAGTLATDAAPGPLYACIDPSGVGPGDAVDGSDAGSAACTSQGLTVVAAQGRTDLKACGTGVAARSVSDSKSQAKLDTLHTDLGALKTTAAAPGPASTVTLADSQWGLLFTILFAGFSLLLLLGAVRTTRSVM